MGTVQMSMYFSLYRLVTSAGLVKLSFLISCKIKLFNYNYPNLLTIIQICKLPVNSSLVILLVFY